MGLLIHDAITLRNGKTITDLYASFRYCNLIVSCMSPSANSSSNAWMVTTTYGLWTSNTACTQGGTPLESRELNYQMTTDQPLFTSLYGVLKSKFKSTVDC